MTEKDGKKTFYSLQLSDSSRLDLIRVALREDLDEEFWESDQAGLNRIIDRRRSESERYFDEVAERLGKLCSRTLMGCDWSFSALPSSKHSYCGSRSW